MRTGFDRRSVRWIAIRVGMVAALLAAGFAAVFSRAVQLQVLQSDRLAGLAKDQYVREIELRPRRGAITDRNGTPLAADLEVDSIFVDPRELPARRHAEVRRLARALSVDAGALERKLSRRGRFTWVKRRVSPAESEAVRALRLPGVGIVKESRRYYPSRELAAQVLGLVGDDGDGLEGVEHAWDEALQGESMRVPSLRDARGGQVLGEAPAPDRVLEGGRVELTLDQGLQLAAERSLGQAMSAARATAGMVVALDPRTGEVLALANAPTFNANAPRRAEAMRNRAVLDVYEPGSTFKVFTVAAALDAGVLQPQEPINCENGAWRVGNHVIHDHRGLGWVGPARIVAASSNVGAAKIGQRLGRERLHRALQAFGFGERVGVGLRGEPRGQLPFPKAEVSLATMSFGQGVTASALQITAGIAAIANGGMLLKPHLVRRVVDPATGRVLSQAHPTPVRRAVSRETAATMARWMEGVVHDPDGTGRKARLDGWRAAGKTGTAQKADPVTGGYSADKRFSSFVGFAPADDPRVVVGVFIDEPRGEVYGGDVAAPVFREVAEYALKSMGAPPSATLAGPGTAGEAPAAEPAAPQADDEPGWATVEVATRVAPGPGGVAVPALAGLPARAAIRTLESLELLGEVSGSGRVASQSPKPGAVVGRGARVRIVLAPPG